MKSNSCLPSGPVIHPTPGRVLWYYPGGLDQLADGEQPRAATVAYVYGDHCINIGFLNVNGQACHATSVVLLQPGDELTESGFCCWLPYQLGQAKAAVSHEDNAPVSSSAPEPRYHDVLVLYPAIKAAMDELSGLKPGASNQVDRAFNTLHRAYWSETPAPVGAAELRPV